jgi:hypothetical protein
MSAQQAAQNKHRTLSSGKLAGQSREEVRDTGLKF